VPKLIAPKLPLPSPEIYFCGQFDLGVSVNMRCHRYERLGVVYSLMRQHPNTSRQLCKFPR